MVSLSCEMMDQLVMCSVNARLGSLLGSLLPASFDVFSFGRRFPTHEPTETSKLGDGTCQAQSQRKLPIKISVNDEQTRWLAKWLHGGFPTIPIPQMIDLLQKQKSLEALTQERLKVGLAHG